MPLSKPSLSTLIERITKDLEGRLQTVGSVLTRSVLGVIAKVQAGAMYAVYGYIDSVALNFFPQTCDETNLIRWGTMKGLSRTPATYAEFNVTFAGTNGSVIEAGTILKRNDGVEYQTQAEVTISGGTAVVEVIASTPGATGNTNTGVKLNLLSPISGVDGSATVGSATTIANDQEDLELFRQRVLEAFAAPPHGGNENDYIAWAKEVSGVTRAWVYPDYLGDGSVGVAFVFDGRPNIIPTTPDVTAMQTYLTDPSRAPVTADVFAFAPVADPITFTISGLNPNNADVRAAVEAELRDLISRDGEPGGTILLSRMREAISTAAGEEDHSLTSPSANWVSGAGEIPTFGSVSFV